jgi:protein-disulfide isomerase
MNRCTRAVLTITLALVSLSSAAQQSAAAPAKTTAGASAVSATPLPSEATFKAFLQRTFGWNSSLTWKVVDIKPSEAAGISEGIVVFSTPQGQQALQIYVTADQKHAFTGELMPFGADPFAEARLALKDANGPSHGPKDATLTIVEFGDLECPACKRAQPNINKLMEEEPKARLVFQNFPLQMHKWAMTGAKYLDCLGRQSNDAVWKFIGLTYDHQAEVNEQNVDQMLKGYVKEAGADPDVVAACVATPETQKRVQESMALGEKVGVNSTPTFYINGRRLLGLGGENAPYDVVKEMVDFEVANAGK